MIDILICSPADTLGVGTRKDKAGTFFAVIRDRNCNVLHTVVCRQK